jgi:hypothetical protein
MRERLGLTRRLMLVERRRLSLLERLLEGRKLLEGLLKGLWLLLCGRNRLQGLSWQRSIQLRKEKLSVSRSAWTRDLGHR